jgi:hypothetical protein
VEAAATSVAASTPALVETKKGLAIAAHAAAPETPHSARYDFLRYPASGKASDRKPYSGFTTQGAKPRAVRAATSGADSCSSSFMK